MNYRKTLLAAVLAVPLALTACGSDEENADSTASATSTESSATSSEKPDEDKDNDNKDEDDKPEESEDNKPEDENAPEGEDGDNPDRPAGEGESNNAAGRDGAGNEGGNNPAPAPAPGGGGANNADKEAITNLVNGMDDGGDNMQALAYYTLDNSCTAYINSQGGAQTLRQQADAMVGPNGQPLTFSEVGRMTGTAGMSMAQIQKVENIRVNGDTATAYVTSDQAASEMQFAREGGKWKICPAG